MEARWARTARGWSVALLAGVLTATLHASAGGTFPALSVILMAVLLSGLASTALVGRRTSLPRIMAAVAAGQVTFHSVFTVFAGSPAVVPGADAHAGHAGHTLLPLAEPAHAGAAHSGPGMLLAHVVAGLLSAVLLAHSERAFSALKRLAACTLRVLSRMPSARPLPRRRSAGIGTTVALPQATTLLRLLRYRGPPALLRAA